jgi:hypothetical protein
MCTVRDVASLPRVEHQQATWSVQEKPPRFGRVNENEDSCGLSFPW